MRRPLAGWSVRLFGLTRESKQEPPLHVNYQFQERLYRLLRSGIRRAALVPTTPPNGVQRADQAALQPVVGADDATLIE